MAYYSAAECRLATADRRQRALRSCTREGPHLKARLTGTISELAMHLIWQVYLELGVLTMRYSKVPASVIKL
jgi:hypothetical protein